MKLSQASISHHIGVAGPYAGGCHSTPPKTAGVYFYNGFRKNCQENPGIDFYSGFRKNYHGGGVQIEILLKCRYRLL